MTRVASFQEVLANSFDYNMGNVYTSIPGVVVNVYSSLSGMRVDVKPTINLRNEEGTESVERPVILNVPFQMPLTPTGGLSFPVKKGAPVWLNFSMRGLDVWKSGGGESAAPTDSRRFDIRDCVATPGVYPTSLSPNSPDKRTNSHSPEDVVLVHNIGSGSEVEIRLKPSGDVYINSPSNVYVNCENASVEAKGDIDFKCDNYKIECASYEINTASLAQNTVNYSLIATGDSENVRSQGTFRMDGQFILNDIHIETHKHPYEEGVTDGPVN